MEERTPVPALFLHWLFSVVLIVASPVKTAFEFLSLLYTYSTHIWMGVFLGVGLLYLLYKPGSTWVRPLGLPPLLGKNWGRRESTLYAFFFTATNIFLVFAPWVPAAALTGAKFMKGHPLDGLPWYLYPTLGTGILFAGGLYWVGFEIIYPKYKHMELKVQRIPVVDLVDEVQVRELVFFKWLPSGADGDSE